MDNGQHVFLRGCRAYRGLLRRLGSEQHVRVQPRLEIPVLAPGRAPYVLRRGSLPAPLHLAGALAAYPHLTPGQRIAAARAALALRRIGPGELARERETLGDWLARHGQGPRSVAALWDLIALPTLNLPAPEASLELGAFVFRRGLLSSPDDGDIGFHVGTLAEVIARPAERSLREAGVEVRLGFRVTAVERSARGLRVAGRDGSAAASLEGADAAIVCLPHARAATLLEPLLGRAAARWRGLGASPIVNLHVLYDRPVSEHAFAAGVDTPVQYLFDRSGAGGAPAGSQYLAVSLSGAAREMAMSVEELRRAYEPALRALLPAAADARIESFSVTREHAATFRASPGVGALRPGPRTGVPGLVLAGAWTGTGWPATLEGAVLSGHAAAAEALRQAAPGAGGNGRLPGTPRRGAAEVPVAAVRVGKVGA
jgi:squalene-associated FAD-dependent desaturase